MKKTNRNKGINSGFLMQIIKFIVLTILISCTMLLASCSIFESCFVGSSGSDISDNSGNSNSNNSGGSSIDGNNNKPQSRTVTIYKESSDYKPTGDVDEQLITSKLLIDLSNILGSNFKGNLQLDFKVDLAYKETFTSPSPTFTFFYYSQNEINSEYLLGENTVTILGKEKKTYTFSLNVYLEGNVIYGARACNYDMGYDGYNILGMYLDYRTFSLNNYYVTVTQI